MQSTPYRFRLSRISSARDRDFFPSSARLAEIFFTSVDKMNTRHFQALGGYSHRRRNDFLFIQFHQLPEMVPQFTRWSVVAVTWFGLAGSVCHIPPPYRLSVATVLADGLPLKSAVPVL